MSIYRPYVLLKNLQADEMTEEEQVRVLMASKIPNSVRGILEERAEAIKNQVIELETVRDEIIDFLEGEWGNA